MILTSIVVGRLITRTGRYKVFIIAGPAIMGLGYYLLTRLGYDSAANDVRLSLVVVGLGLGAVLQTYTLIVQNVVPRENLGVATSTTQLSRSLGAPIGVAVFGPILTSRMQTELAAHLPAAAQSHARQFSGSSGIGSVINSSGLGQLPDAVVTGIREGLAAAIHPIFVVGIPIIAVAFVASIFIKELPLRTTAYIDQDRAAEERGGETFEDLSRSAPQGMHASPESVEPKGNRDLLATGAALAYLAAEIDNANGGSPELISAASALVPAAEGTDRERARLAARQVIRPLATRTLLVAARDMTPRV